MVTLPVPRIVTTSPATVAINKFQLAYVKLPELLDVGGTKVKFASPTVFAGITKLLRTVLINFTWNKVLIVADV